MSTVAVSLGAKRRTTESDQAHLHGSALHSAVFDVATIAKSGPINAPDHCPDAACERALLSAAKSGDQHAFVELCRRHGPHLKRRIRRIVRNLEDAEDVFQETLLSAFRHLAGFRAQCSFRTWMMRIATNTSLMLLRKRRSHPETGFGLITSEGKEVEFLQVFDPLPNPEQLYARRQASQRVSQAIGMLPVGFRLLVEHYHQDEIKLADAANAIGITVAAAKSRLLRARLALRRHLNRMDKPLFD